jgi:hypothetical protein
LSIGDSNVYPFWQNVRVRGKSPRATRTSQSISFLIRDAILVRAKAMPFFSGFNKFATNRGLQVQSQDLPFFGVYFISDIGTADGDAQDGEPRFRTVARYGFSIIIANNDPDQAELQLDKGYVELTTDLFTDPTLYNNSLFKIQAYTNTSRQHIFGTAGTTNETPIAECRFELICDLGVINFEPWVPDDLELIHVSTAFPAGGTPEEQAAIQQVTAEYDLDQGD